MKMRDKDGVKVILLRIIVAIALFIAAFTWFNYQEIRNKGNVTAELTDPSYPVLEISGEAGDYNQMLGYQEEIDSSLVRSQITVLESDRDISLKLYHYGYDITAIQYVLYQESPDEPLEKGTINKLKKAKGIDVKKGSLHLESDFKSRENYYLRFAVRLNNNTQAFFYTRVLYGEGMHLADYLTFARKFHDNLFSREKMEENAIYLEPSETAVDNTLENVTISSSVESVFFGDLEIKEGSEPRIYVQELNSTYGVLQINTQGSCAVSGDQIQNYDITETYKVRYTPERIYLLDYQRTMDAYYNENLIDSSNNMVTLGIQNRNNIDYRSADKGRKVAFVQNGQLWYYNYDSSDVAKVFSFSSENPADRRNDLSCHGLRILSFNKDGDITYLAYGYINRGHHEGKNGILIMKYDAKENYSKEIAFLSTSIPYESLKEDLSEFAYLNPDNIFYCRLAGDFHEINLKNKKDKILQSGLAYSNLTASVDQNLIAIEESRKAADNKKITLINLDNGKEKVFTAGKSKRIKAVGFLTNDFIYGTASEEDTGATADGDVLFPMSVLHIVDSEGNKVKDYSRKKRYVTQTSIKGSVLNMTLSKKENNTFKEAGEDFIRYKEESNTSDVTLSYKYSHTMRNQLYLKFPDYIYIQIAPDLTQTHFSVDGDDRNISLKKSGQTTLQYMVYAEGEKRGVYSSLPQAISVADEERGNVIDNSDKVLWECVFPDYGIVAGMDEVIRTKEERRSLEACLAMMAALNARKRSIESIYAASGTIENRIEDCTGYPGINLSGCSVDEVLYYVSEGMPILARYNNKRYVILMSYNATRLRYLDPVTGKSTATDRKGLTSQFEKAGNEFYSYLIRE